MTNKEKTDEMGRLYILCEALEPMALEIEKTLEELSPEKDKNEIEELLPRLLYYKQQLKLIDDRIQELRSDFMVFSMEEIYHMFGRYDKFISIDFHHNSESAREYGRTIMGVPIYNRREREDIEVALKESPIPRTNGYVRFDLSEMNKLPKDKINTLNRKGFLSGDIITINHTAIDKKDAYKEKGEKEIPNTINIEIPHDPTFNPEWGFLTLYKRRIEDNNKPLIQSEWDEYLAYKILYQKDKITEDEWEEIYEPNSKIIKEAIRFHLLRSKMRRSINLSVEELNDLENMFAQRRKKRYRMVDKEINKSANKKLQVIIQEDSELYMSIKKEALFYETINLSPYGAKFPIYLELERYLHIFVRHCKDFQIGDWKNGGKLAFPYSFKDMKRLLELAIKELTPKIEEKLEQGKEFSIFDKKAFYFNGNYYVVHIDKNGRLLSCYPHTNPD